MSAAITPVAGGAFLAAARANLPGDEPAQREQALARFAAAGWPSPVLEHWYYSDWTILAERRYTAATDSESPAFGFDRAQLLPLKPLDAVQSTTRFALDALNRALASAGVDKTFDGHAQVPFLITQHVGQPQAMRHLRHRIALSAGAQATLILWDAPDVAADTLLTAVMTLDLAAGSRLTLLRVQQAGAQATRALHLSASVAADATLEVVHMDVAAARARQEFDITLTAPGACYRQAGLVAAGDQHRLDTFAHVRHAAPRTESRIAARMLAAGQARLALNAKVQVQPGALKSDSETRLSNLLLSDRAEIDAKPDLVIDADDVKCAHGASFGQLDEDALFYLRARGVDAATARALLTQAFAQAALEHIPDHLPGLKNWAEGRVRSLLGEAAA